MTHSDEENEEIKEVYIQPYAYDKLDDDYE